MTGLIVLGVGIPLVLGYIWLLRAAVRLVRRKTGSNFAVALVVAGILAITFGDTIFNRWYHKQVLCKKEDVGGAVFERVKLPPGHWDDSDNRPALPLTMSEEKPFLGRYANVEKFERGGTRPFTAYERSEITLVDLYTRRVLSRSVDYFPAGGIWWAMPFAVFFDRGSVVGWLLSRSRSAGCVGLSPYTAVDVREGAFERHSAKDTQ